MRVEICLKPWRISAFVTLTFMALSIQHAQADEGVRIGLVSEFGLDAHPCEDTWASRLLLARAIQVSDSSGEAPDNIAFIEPGQRTIKPLQDQSKNNWKRTEYLNLLMQNIDNHDLQSTPNNSTSSSDTAADPLSRSDIDKTERFDSSSFIPNLEFALIDRITHGDGRFVFSLKNSTKENPFNVTSHDIQYSLDACGAGISVRPIDDYTFTIRTVRGGRPPGSIVAPFLLELSRIPIVKEGELDGPDVKISEISPTGAFRLGFSEGSEIRLEATRRELPFDTLLIQEKISIERLFDMEDLDILYELPKGELPKLFRRARHPNELLVAAPPLYLDAIDTVTIMTDSFVSKVRSESATLGDGQWTPGSLMAFTVPFMETKGPRASCRVCPQGQRHCEKTDECVARDYDCENWC